MTNLYVEYIMAEYLLTKLSIDQYSTKTTSEITIVSQNESLVQLYRIKKLISPKR